jgi:hypothetical protein
MTGMPPTQFTPGTQKPARRSWLSIFALLLLWPIAIVASAWACGALWFDLPAKFLSQPVTVLYAVLILAVLFLSRGPWVKLAIVAACFSAVLSWWLRLQPSNDRQWQMDVERTAYAEVQGSRVMLHNVRNCSYQTETQYQPGWQTRIVDLDAITGIDIAITYWGSPYMAHPIISFQFGDMPPVCFSIETRKEVGESYSAIGGFYRQYELAYICADERDVIRLRTNFRKGEEVYLYRLNVTPEAARGRFMEYITTMNELHVQPRWYNAATTNCTTAIRAQHGASKRPPFDWRMLVNGYMDEMLYDNGALKGGLPFAELKEKAHINEAARAANDAPDFSRKIRAGRPGFDLPVAPNPAAL